MLVSDAPLKPRHGLTNLHHLLYSGVSTLSNGYERAHSIAWMRLSLCSQSGAWLLRIFTGVNLVVLNHWADGKKGMTVFPTSLQGGVRKNEPTTTKAVGKSQCLDNGDLSSAFLRFCHFSKSTLVVNCVLAIDVQVQFYTKTLQLSKLIPNRSELPSRNSFTRKGLFHASEMGYRFPGFTEHSAPEIFNWPCNLILFRC